MKFIRIAAATAALLAAGAVHAQGKSLREQIVGSWIFGVAEVVAPGGVSVRLTWIAGPSPLVEPCAP